MKENRTHVKLACDGVLLIGGSKNNRTRHWFLTQNRKWIMRRQPWIPIKRQPFYLFKNWNFITTTFKPQHNKTQKAQLQVKKVRPLKWDWWVECECILVARSHWPRTFRSANPSRSSCLLRMFVLPVEDCGVGRQVYRN